MAKGASERETNYIRAAAVYLRAVQIARGWSQSEVARQVGIHQSNINKALNEKQALGLEYLLLLEDKSGVPIPAATLEAAKGRRSQGHASPEEVAAFLDSSPAWREIIALGQELAATKDSQRKAEIKAEIDTLMGKVA